jgi:DeoR/GlpR family transcriptional regulator of sugar metabolism
MNGAARRAHTVELLSAFGELSVETLATRLKVTESTIRRDLQRLAAQGQITRTFRGATVVNSPLSEPSLAQRASTARAEKDAIGAWCAAQVQEGETILLDAGTTTGRLAAHLRARSGITVVTSGLTAILELANADDIELVVLGGKLRHVSQGLVGPLTELSLSRLTANRVFLGADGLRADLGICEADLVQTRGKELMAERGRHVYVLADSSKLGASPFDAWAPLPAMYTLVTDDGAREEDLQPFREQEGVEVVLAPRFETGVSIST